jgi:hypothetical protein
MIVLMMVKRFVPSTEPLGYIPRVGEAKFEVANPSRSRSRSILNKDSDNEPSWKCEYSKSNKYD